MTKIYDREGSLRRMGGDPLLFDEMVEFLHKDTPRHLGAAKRARAEGNLGELARFAHSLKGLASNFGASRAVAAAAELERLAGQRESQSLDGQFREVEMAFEELLTELPLGAGTRQQP